MVNLNSSFITKGAFDLLKPVLAECICAHTEISEAKDQVLFLQSAKSDPLIYSKRRLHINTLNLEPKLLEDIWQKPAKWRNRTGQT